MDQDFLVLHPLDNVGVLIRARDPIPAGHKIALRAIRAGEKVMKYGNPIGIATADIREGAPSVGAGRIAADDEIAAACPILHFMIEDRTI